MQHFHQHLLISSATALVNGVFDRQGEWASIGLADMFNAGGAIVSEEVTKASGDATGDVVTAELLVSFTK